MQIYFSSIKAVIKEALVFLSPSARHRLIRKVITIIIIARWRHLAASNRLSNVKSFVSFFTVFILDACGLWELTGCQVCLAY